jgi:hypothetical protein
LADLDAQLRVAKSRYQGLEQEIMQAYHERVNQPTNNDDEVVTQQQQQHWEVYQSCYPDDEEDEYEQATERDDDPIVLNPRKHHSYVRACGEA